jgi:hypothetical protein
MLALLLAAALSFDELEQLARREPARALHHATELANPYQRERIERAAFLHAATVDRPAALRFLPRYLHRPFLAEVNFGDALALARHAEPAHAGALLIASARRSPSAALRLAADYMELPYGATVLAQAAAMAPDEAAMVAAGDSPPALRLRAWLAASPSSSIRLLATIATLPNLPLSVRGRAAILFREVDAGRIALAALTRLAADPVAHFSHTLTARLRATGDAALALDHYLATRSRELCLNTPPAEFRSWKPRDLLLLLGYARPEDVEQFFPRIFDAALRPNLSSRPLAALVSETNALTLRQFLATALAEDRFTTFLQAARDTGDRTAVVTAALRDIGSLDDALLAAELIDALEPALLPHAARVLQEHLSLAPSPLYGILAAMLAARHPSALPAELLAPYSPFLANPESFTLPCQPACIEQHVFYDDRDGVESFASFRATLHAWQVTEHDGWLHALRRENNRQFEIYANIPIDLLHPASASLAPEALRRRQAWEQALAAAPVKPSILVHRGHSYHVEKSLSLLRPAHRLVILGSCRGLRDVAAVLDAAPHAHVIATRGIGTQAINDPLLVTLREHLLAAGAIRWPLFWDNFRARAGARPYFAQYVPPHRNPVTSFLRAWYGYLSQ